MRVPENPIFIGLDLETAPINGFPAPFALQPWRFFERTAVIRCMSLAKTNGEADLLVSHDPAEYSLRLQMIPPGALVVAWKATFDISWLLAAGVDISQIFFIDGMLLWKHHSNSQRMEHGGLWNISAATKRWLSDLPWADQYIAMKKEEHTVGESGPYWETRAKLDAYVAALIAERIWPLLSEQQKRLALIEAQCLKPFSQSWLDGIKINSNLAIEKAPAITREMYDIEKKLGVLTPPTASKDDVERTLHFADLGINWIPSKILSSPLQKQELIYTDWGNKISFYTKPSKKYPEGQPSTDKTALTYLADVDNRALDLLRWSELNTQFVKFIRGILKTRDYLQSDLSHPEPKLFSTYTGRCTYSTKSGQKGEYAKAKIGIPLHQMPRPKDIRKLVMVDR